MSLPHRRMLCREDTTSVFFFFFPFPFSLLANMVYHDLWSHETLAMSPYVMKLSRGAIPLLGGGTFTNLCNLASYVTDVWRKGMESYDG
ncbi:hypothetical protein LY78DRAFT_90771 [Colletotrichum sublineola]|nr:hypothetical protein LY78DRAFT_90771 [Colletotrichum sublineola]